MVKRRFNPRERAPKGVAARSVRSKNDKSSAALEVRPARGKPYNSPIYSKFRRLVSSG
jgi:hypothetical protein